MVTMKVTSQWTIEDNSLVKTIVVVSILYIMYT